MLIFLFNSAASSQIECGTPELTEAERADYVAFLQSLQGRNTSSYPPIALPIHVFVISDDTGNLMNNGTNYYTSISNLLPAVNQKFDNGISFYLCGVSYINDSLHHSLTSLNSAASLYNFIHVEENYPHDAITVVINKSSDGYPYASQPHLPYQIVRFGGGITDANNLAHELGHCLGLLHTHARTFAGVSSPGVGFFKGAVIMPDCSCNTLLLNNSLCAINNNCDTTVSVCDGIPNLLPCNCCNSGDLIPDTPVDPGTVGPPAYGACSPNLSGSSPCIVESFFIPWLQPDSIFQYDNFYPAYSNLMGYYSTASGFTIMQKQRTLDVLWNHPNRAYLIDTIPPACMEYFSIADKGKVERVYLNALNQWQTEPVANVKMTIDNHITGQTAIKTSMTDGRYSVGVTFPNATDMEGTVVQNQSVNENGDNPVFNADNGVSTMDLVEITKHVLAVLPLKSPYYWIAADANNSGSITTQDVIKIRKIILDLDQSFSPTPSWRFMPRYYLDQQWGFEAVFFQNPFTAELAYAGNSSRKYLPSSGEPSYLDKLDVLEYTEDIEEEDTWSFLMIKTGDVNSSADISSSAPPSGSNLSILPATHNCLEAGQTAVVNFKAKDGEALSGYQFALAVDPNYAELTGVNKADITPFSMDYFNLQDIANGHLKALWYDELNGGTISITPAKSLFQFNIKAKAQVCHIDQIVEINTAAMPAAFYDAAGYELTPELSLELIPQVIRHQLQAVYPNPASNDLSFHFKVNDQPAQVSITVQDANGNLVQHSGQYATGEHTFVFNNTGGLNNGLLSYAVSIGTDAFPGNVIKL